MKVFTLIFMLITNTTNLIDSNLDNQYYNKIQIENKTYSSIEAAVVDRYDYIIAKVKIGSYKTVEIDLGDTSASGVRVFYKEGWDYDFKYQAYKDPYSSYGTPKFVIED